MILQAVRDGRAGKGRRDGGASFVETRERRELLSPAMQVDQHLAAGVQSDAMFVHLALDG